jgi:hypothetical protein
MTSITDVVTTVAIAIGGVLLLYIATACVITAAARCWFSEKEKHLKRLLSTGVDDSNTKGRVYH